MPQNVSIPKPIHRGKLRTLFGKEYFIFKRRILWWLKRKSFAKQNLNVDFPFPIFSHQSLLLRPLKDVDMHLQHNKVTNLRLAIQHLNGIILQPGETFSIWKNVGRTSRSKGYLKGLTLENGKISSGIGGRLCQLGNLLYWMVLHTPMTITERWRHGYDVFPDVNRTIPFACGATLSYNYIDLQFTNTTTEQYQIKLWLDDTHLCGSILASKPPTHSYEIFETDHHFSQQWWGGYTRHNRIWKRVINKYDGKSCDGLVSENNAIMMYSPLIDNKS
jgi:vancomycin resistance protein VanW